MLKEVPYPGFLILGLCLFLGAFYSILPTAANKDAN